MERKLLALFTAVIVLISSIPLGLVAKELDVIEIGTEFNAEWSAEEYAAYRLNVESSGFYNILAEEVETFENELTLYVGSDNSGLLVEGIGSARLENAYLESGVYIIGITETNKSGEPDKGNVKINVDLSDYLPLNVTFGENNVTYGPNQDVCLQFTPEESGDYIFTYNGMGECLIAQAMKYGVVSGSQISTGEKARYRFTAGDTIYVLLMTHYLDIDEEKTSVINISKAEKDIDYLSIVKHDVIHDAFDLALSENTVDVKITYTDNSTENVSMSDYDTDIGFEIEYNGAVKGNQYAPGWQSVKLHYLDTYNLCRVYITPLSIFAKNNCELIESGGEIKLDVEHSYEENEYSFCPNKTGYYKIVPLSEDFDLAFEQFEVEVYDNHNNLVEANEEGEYFILGGKPYYISLYYGFDEEYCDEFSIAFKGVKYLECHVFPDMMIDGYYVDAVRWANEKGIVLGDAEGKFLPDYYCSRGDFVTMLYRFAGSPEHKSEYNPFTDVKQEDYYYDAVVWAVENEIIKGTTETTFSPDFPCTRGQCVTMLYRYSGNPRLFSQFKCEFADLVETEYYYNAAIWAYDNYITSGTSELTFSPNDFCTRAQIVTFLYRY